MDRIAASSCRPLALAAALTALLLGPPLAGHARDRAPPEAQEPQHADVAFIDVLAAGFLQDGLDREAAAALKERAGDGIEARRLRSEAEGLFRRAIHYGTYDGAFEPAAVLDEPAQRAATRLGLAVLRRNADGRSVDEGLFWLAVAAINEGCPTDAVGPLLLRRHAITGLDAARLARATEAAAGWLVAQAHGAAE
jgi:hypothetical protein